MVAAIIKWPAEGHGLSLTCNNNLSSPMMAAWFQSITSENGNSHPLLSITGTQAACGHRGTATSAAARHQGSFQLPTNTLTPFSAQAQVRQHCREHQKPQQGSPSVYSFPLWVYSYALKGGIWKDSGICNLVLTLPGKGRTVQCSRWNAGEFNIK